MRPHAWWMDAIDVRAHRRGMRRDGAGQPEKTGAGRQASGAHAGCDVKGHATLMARIGTTMYEPSRYSIITNVVDVLSGVCAEG